MRTIRDANKTRNIPVQVIYTSQVDTIDEFVAIAVLFSILSVIFSIFQEMSHKIKFDHGQFCLVLCTTVNFLKAERSHI